MKRLVIAIDCDDVLIPSTPYVLEQYNRQFGTEVALEDAHDPDAAWGAGDRAEHMRRIADIQLSDDYALLRPFDDGVSAVRQLAAHHELHLVTTRDKRVERLTLGMLDRYLYGCFASIEHVGQDRTKGEVCGRIGADVLIDDNSNYLLSAIERGLPPGGALHFGDYEWNRPGEEVSEVTSCRTWAEVLERIGEIAHAA